MFFYHKISDYNYNLPDERIAKYPLPERDSSKLLIYNSGQISEKRFYDIESFFEKGDLLVFNNTKVIQARLLFKRQTGAQIEIFCLEPDTPSDYNLSFQSNEECTWKCIVGNSKKWKDDVLQVQIPETDTILQAVRLEKNEETQTVKFFWNNPNLSFSDILDKFGKTPIPPYLNRDSEESDKIQYQTVYSKFNGSVAAPTAGLHFTDKLLDRIRKKHAQTAEITLHVGAGTFKPVKTESTEHHEMHTEHFVVDRENVEIILQHLGRITSVGTTTVRTLESLYRIGVKLTKKLDNPLHVSQYEIYKENSEISAIQSLEAILKHLRTEGKQQIWASTQIMIVPPYEFKIVNRLITNFHQPQSTLLLLVAAFTKKNQWKDIYNYALNNNFRFLSYGDSSLLIP